jgi:hypothetical protein
MIDSDIRELDHRRTDGIEVTLLWNSRTNRVLVAVDDERRNASFELVVPADHALEAFRHPYGYAALAPPASRLGLDGLFDK